MLCNQNSAIDKDFNSLPETPSHQAQLSKQSISTSTPKDSQNLQYDQNKTPSQQPTQPEEKKYAQAGFNHEENLGEQEQQEQQALDQSQISQNLNSEDQQLVEEDYPQDYDQDTQLQKSVKRHEYSYKNAQDEDSEWPQPLVSRILKQNQVQLPIVFFWPQKIEVQKFLTNQQYVEFINKNYLKKLYQNQDESEGEQIVTKVKKPKQTQTKKVTFKDNIIVKRFDQNEQVTQITLTNDQIQELNTLSQTKSPYKQHQPQQIIQYSLKSKDSKNNTKFQKSQEQIKCPQYNKNEKQQKETFEQAQNKQNQFSSDNQKETNEENCIQIRSTLEGRIIKLVK